MIDKNIKIKGAREHNLKNLDIDIPREKMVVVTGPSGSGKSSLAFDTIYAEGQRRYVESLSAYARQFLGVMEKPDLESIEGLSPAISIEQKAASKNPRSTVGTVTEIYDYLRLLFARVGTPYCYNCGRRIEQQTVQQIVDTILEIPEGTKMMIMAPIIRGKKGEFKDVLEEIRREGFIRARIDGEILEVDQDIELDKQKKHDIEVVIDRLIAKPSIKERLTESVELSTQMSSGLVIVSTPEDEYTYSEQFACPHCHISYAEISPRMFSFNSPYGACPECDGLGTKMEIDESLVVPDESKNMFQGGIVPLGEQPKGGWQSSVLKAVLQRYNIDFFTPIKDYSEAARQAILYGKGTRNLNVKKRAGKMKGDYETDYEGVIPNLKRRYTQTKSSRIRNWIKRFMSEKPCPVCDGARLKKEARSVKIDGLAINEVTAKSVSSLFDFFNSLEFSDTDLKIAGPILKELRERTGFLVNVGVEYLTLDRSAVTLSGGESQRIRLATQIGSQLAGVLYILDEPSIGLHMRDNSRLIQTLKDLRDIGNTVIIVEHDAGTMLAADHIIDLGPGAGRKGGEVVAEGTPEDIKSVDRSITGQYLSGKKEIPVPDKRRNGNGKYLTLYGCQGNNLKDLKVKFPIGKFTCITGVSGSGKSTLVNETLFPILQREFYNSTKSPLKYGKIEGMEHFDKVIDIDQNPIGRTPRSNPATYTKVFDHIRDLYASLKESKIRGYKKGRFSFNVKGGRCEACRGKGTKKIEMHFLPDVYVPCEVCEGKRYNRETLEIKYRGKNIADVLNMTVNEAYDFFERIPKIKSKLTTLRDVGLGYIQLGQKATTLSGGEAQRVKLSSELGKKSTGDTLYILDEPTTGLHFEDIKLLLRVLKRLMKQGNTVIIIEHNLDVIKSVDHIIDLGPEGGHKGGYIVTEGTPEEVAEHPDSYTGKFLKEVL